MPEGMDVRSVDGNSSVSAPAGYKELNTSEETELSKSLDDLRSMAKVLTTQLEVLDGKLAPVLRSAEVEAPAQVQPMHEPTAAYTHRAAEVWGVRDQLRGISHALESITNRLEA